MDNAIQKCDEAITLIAKEDLNLETLENRHSDNLDFQEHAVWQIRRALARAFLEGFLLAALTSK